MSETSLPNPSPLEKLQNIEILPDLFYLLHDLQSGKISVKDFDNHAGSVRLRLSTIKQQLQQIENINQSVEQRELEIKNLEDSNRRKAEFLQGLKSFTNEDEAMKD